MRAEVKGKAGGERAEGVEVLLVTEAALLGVTARRYWVVWVEGWERPWELPLSLTLGEPEGREEGYRCYEQMKTIHRSVPRSTFTLQTHLVLLRHTQWLSVG